MKVGVSVAIESWLWFGYCLCVSSDSRPFMSPTTEKASVTCSVAAVLWPEKTLSVASSICLSPSMNAVVRLGVCLLCRHVPQ